MANKVSPQDKLCTSYLEIEESERMHWLRSRTETERTALWQALASHPKLKAMDVASLPQPYQAELCRFVCGDPQRGISPAGRAWQVAPVGDPVSAQIGTYLNQRRMLTIDKPTHLQGALAINLLVNYGPNANIEINRNLLREVTEGEQPEQPQRKPQPNQHTKRQQQPAVAVAEPSAA